MTKHFTDKELACRCCGKQNMTIGFMALLEGLRMAYDRPMTLSSAYRCRAHDKAVGGKGAHTTGQVVDVLVFGVSAFNLIKLAFEHGFTGIGIHQTGPYNKRFIHLDNLLVDFPRPRVWSY